MAKNYDFSGWATRADMLCSDGRVIMKDAFKANDGKTVPLVWNHQHNDPENVLGHAVLENRSNGVYAYCTFNETESGKQAKLLVKHGDVSALSIWANQLKQNGSNVVHGMIRELSLVLAGANPGAFIDNVIAHGEETEEEAIIFTGEAIELKHSECETKETNESNENKEKEEKKVENNKTIKDVIDTMNEEQKNVMYALIGQALENEEEKEDNKGDEKDMKHNIFDNEEKMGNENVLSHSEELAIIADAKRCGSLKDSVLQHGIEHIDYLFPDAKTVTAQPTMIDRDQSWVKEVMQSVHHTPFSRIKSTHANITADEARARGYIKGNKKVNEVFTLLKRTTDPTTVYKKQALERDDIIDITDFDVVAWVKSEMRGKLDEELARAYLIGDGRLSASNDKIDENKIRPIWTDSDLYSVNVKITLPASSTDDDIAKAFIRNSIKARKNYKGSGNPDLFTTEDMVTNCLLLEDGVGRPLYDSIEKLATKLRVRKIITVPVMENQRRTVGSEQRTLLGIIVNLKDYNVGADKGGSVNMFDDFDIDYNQQKYLIETRCSGALTNPYSALVIESTVAPSAQVDEPVDEEPNTEEGN